MRRSESRGDGDREKIIIEGRKMSRSVRRWRKGITIK
jgi:hypothetical protein